MMFFAVCRFDLALDERIQRHISDQGQPPETPSTIYKADSLATASFAPSFTPGEVSLAVPQRVYIFRLPHSWPVRIAIGCPEPDTCDCLIVLAILRAKF
jgi:hypothetical protein